MLLPAVTLGNATSSVRPEQTKRTPLLLAAYYGNTAALRVLLADPRIDIHARDNVSDGWPDAPTRPCLSV